MGGSPGANAFRSALSGAVEPLEIRFEDDAMTELSAVVDAGGIVLLGETHGVVENAAVLAWFVRLLGPAQVGLEWNSSVGAILWDFAHGRPVEISDVGSPDGRITPTAVPRSARPRSGWSRQRGRRLRS